MGIPNREAEVCIVTVWPSACCWVVGYFTNLDISS